ncbi:DUF3592 domain-containing protein [Streptomyces sp. NBC_00448]|uniref:DUF3592 domain-containing protein n=1 Tax=Streptomyces sp. NBC_00448 TaxID=2903652 RepID=UPI002E223D24
MDAMFYGVPALIGLVALAVAIGSVRRALELRAAWRSGLTAEGRCLRTYTTHSEDSTTHHHVYAFTTVDGREVRFEERNGPTTRVAGDHVTVHYTAARPEKATAAAPGGVKNAVGAVAVVAFCGVVIAFCAAFAITVPA